MLPVEFVDELPELMPELLPEFIELPELVLPVDEPLVDDPVPVVLPELVLDGLVLCAGDGVLGVPVVVVALSEGEGVVLLDGVVVVDELELDCAIAAPPAMSKDAAASAVVVFKNEPMVMTPDVVETKCHRLSRQRQIAMSDVRWGGNACARSAYPSQRIGHELLTSALSARALGTPFAPRGRPVTLLRGPYGHQFFFVYRFVVDAFFAVDSVDR